MLGQLRKEKTEDQDDDADSKQHIKKVIQNQS